MIEVIRGPMFAGKTEELMRILNRLQYANQKYILFKSTVDNRYSRNEVVDHNGFKLPAIVIDKPNEIIPAIKKNGHTDVVAIDEAQFFPHDIIDIVATLSRNYRVILAGLDTDFRGCPFGPMGDLLAIADKDIHVKAVCVKCGNPATRTQRFRNGEPSCWDEPIILVSGKTDYEARCTKCHIVKKKGCAA